MSQTKISQMIRTEGGSASETSAARGSPYHKPATSQNRNEYGPQNAPYSSSDAALAFVHYSSKVDWANNLNC